MVARNPAMDKHYAHHSSPHYTLGLDKVGIDAVLEACELAGRVIRSVAPDADTRCAARLLAEASSDIHRDEPLTRSILVEVARALQRRQ
jgi:hypothetical protein